MSDRFEEFLQREASLSDSDKASDLNRDFVASAEGVLLEFLVRR